MRARITSLLRAWRAWFVGPGIVASAVGITAIGCLGEEITKNDFPTGDFDDDGFSEFDDCDDSEPLIYPGADYASEPDTEALLQDLACRVGGELDVDCDDEPDYFCILVNPPTEDLDGDDFVEGEDCDDTNAQIYPGASYESDSDEAQALINLACERGEAVDADCDGEAEYQCVIVNMAD